MLFINGSQDKLFPVAGSFQTDSDFVGLDTFRGLQMDITETALGLTTPDKHLAVSNTKVNTPNDDAIVLKSSYASKRPVLCTFSIKKHIATIFHLFESIFYLHYVFLYYFCSCQQKSN